MEHQILIMLKIGRCQDTKIKIVLYKWAKVSRDLAAQSIKNSVIYITNVVDSHHILSEFSHHSEKWKRKNRDPANDIANH